MKYYMSKSSNNENSSDNNLSVNNVNRENSEKSSRNIRNNQVNSTMRSMQPEVVLPPGSSPASIGLPNPDIYKNRLSVNTVDYANNDDYGSMNAATLPQMQNSYVGDYSASNATYGLEPQMQNYHGMMINEPFKNYGIHNMVRVRPPYMEDMTMTEYLNGRIGEYIKIDLCCGGFENSKVGVLREIGDDFLVLEDGEAGNYIVCGFKGIQLIHIFDEGENE